MSQSSEQFLQQREQEESAISYLRETTAMQRQEYVNDVVKSIYDGNADALQVHVQLKCTEDLIKLLNDNPQYKAALLEAAQKHGKKFELHNCEFQIKEAGVKYDYSQCNDSEIQALHALQKSVKADVDIRENFLKSLPAAGLEILDKETGELVRIYPPSKSSTTIVQTSVK